METGGPEATPRLTESGARPAGGNNLVPAAAVTGGPVGRFSFGHFPPGSV